MNTHTLIIGDSSYMPESIHLVVTSPPYWNIRKYGIDGLGPNRAYSKCLDEIRLVLREIKRVSKKLNQTSIVYKINSAYIELIKQNVGWNSTVDLDTGYEIKIRRQIAN